jgi:hypothetical protein
VKNRADYSDYDAGKKGKTLLTNMYSSCHQRGFGLNAPNFYDTAAAQRITSMRQDRVESSITRVPN